MQYTKTVHVLHDTAQKRVFGHGHTRGSFLSLEPSLEESRVEPGCETIWVINAVARRLPVLQKYTSLLKQPLWLNTKWSVRRKGRLALIPAIRSCMFVRLQPSAKTYTLHGSCKTLVEGMKHKLSDHLRGNKRVGNNGRLSFHPISCGSRDMLTGRKVIGEAQIATCWTLNLQELRVLFDRWESFISIYV